VTLKGIYKLIYTIDKKQEELTVLVELKQVEGFLQPRQNVYYGVALVNGVSYTKDDLTHCVNAKLASQSIGVRMKIGIMNKCREEKKLFSIIKEEIK
jgi:hypothetical protein